MESSFIVFKVNSCTDLERANVNRRLRKKKKKACLAGTQKRGKEEGEQGPDHAAALFSANWFFFLYHKGSGSRQVNCSELAVHLE